MRGSPEPPEYAPPMPARAWRGERAPRPRSGPFRSHLRAAQKATVRPPNRRLGSARSLVRRWRVAYITPVRRSPLRGAASRAPRAALLTKRPDKIYGTGCLASGGEQRVSRTLLRPANTRAVRRWLAAARVTPGARDNICGARFNYPLEVHTSS